MTTSLPDAEPRYDIATVADKTGVSAHTLRYWERAGLVPAPVRDSAGRRAYSDEDIRRLTFIYRLRTTGMPVRQIKAYIDLTHATGNEAARIALLRAHRDQLQARLAEASGHLDAINTKITMYQEKLP